MNKLGFCHLKPKKALLDQKEFKELIIIQVEFKCCRPNVRGRLLISISVQMEREGTLDLLEAKARGKHALGMLRTQGCSGPVGQWVSDGKFGDDAGKAGLAHLRALYEQSKNLEFILWPVGNQWMIFWAEKWDIMPSMDSFILTENSKLSLERVYSYIIGIWDHKAGQWRFFVCVWENFQ